MNSSRWSNRLGNKRELTVSFGHEVMEWEEHSERYV